MKLLTKTTLYHIILAISVFTIGGGITFYKVRGYIQEDLNQYFDALEERISTRIEDGEEIKSRRVQLSKLETIPPMAQDTIIDTTFYNGSWHLPLKKKIVYRDINGQAYRIGMYKSFEEGEDRLEAVVGTVVFLGFTFLILFLLFNYYISRRIWGPFNYTLNQIKQFDLREQKPLEFMKTDVQEFKELNQLLTVMTHKIQQDYQNLKEFTENASHEFQTPLAIIQSKLELLLSNNHLNDEQARLIQSAYQATSKLSRLGKALALITRIENQEFQDVQQVDLSQSLENTVFNFQELVELRDLSLDSHIEPGVKIRMAPLLADILLNNLIKNAIKHNLEGGSIQLELKPQYFEIRNTGPKPQGDPQEFFIRFRKGNQASDSLGLGLAIVKKICDVNHLSIDYRYEDSLHRFRIFFPDEERI